ncbi:MAG: nucleoside monophosphate kinase [Candidatus Saccharibacteria bacterium]
MRSFSEEMPNSVCEKKLIIIHGFPGAGKSTNAERFCEDNHNVGYVSIGNIWRAIKNKHKSSMHSEFVINADITQPQPDELTNDILFEEISREHNDKELVLIDGYPRFESAIEPFFERISKEKSRVLGGICLEATIQTSVIRMFGRGARKGEEQYTINGINYADKYNQYLEHTHNRVLPVMQQRVPFLFIDANRESDTVYQDFVSSVSKIVGLYGNTLNV